MSGARRIPRCTQLNPVLVVCPRGGDRRPHEVNIRFMDASQLVAHPFPDPGPGPDRASRLKAFRSLPWVVLPICVVLVSACSSDHSDPTEPGVDVPDVPQAGWSTPVSLFNAGGGRIAYAGNGRLFALGKTTASGNLQVRHSTDDGQTWNSPVNTGISRDLVLFRSVAAVGNTLHILTSAGDNASLIYSRSDDGGNTWPVSHDLTNNVEVQRAHRASIVVNGNFVHVVNSRHFDAPNRTVTYWRSTDGGATFSAPKTIFTEADGGGVNPDLAIGLDGVVHLVIEDWRGGNPYPAPGTGGVTTRYFRSTDNGATWPSAQQGVVLGNPLLRGRLVAIGGRVTAIMETQQQPGVFQELWQARSSNDGVTWEPAVRIMSVPNSHLSHPVAAGGPASHVYIAAIDESNRRVMSAFTTDNGSNWSSPLVAGSFASNGFDFPFSMVAVGGFVHLIAAGGLDAPAMYVRMRVP